MFPILAGLGLIVLGLIGAFFGYRIFRWLLPIYGGVAGFLLAWAWLGESAWLLALIIGVALAVVFMILAYAAWSVLIALGGVIMGAALGVDIGASLNLWGWMTALIAIGLAIVFGALFFWVRNEMVILSTAASGGTLVGRGVGELFGWQAGGQGVINPNPAWLTILVAVAGLVVFIAGLLYQWRNYLKLRWYSQAAHVSPSIDNSATAIRGAATRAGAQVDMAAGATRSAVTAGGAAVAGAATAAAAATRTTVTDAGGAVSDVAWDVKADVTGGVDAAGEKLADAGAAVSDATWDAKSGVAGAVDAAGEKLEDAGEIVSDWAGDVKADVSGAVHAAGDKLADAGESVSDVAGDVKAGAAGAVDAAGDKLADAGAAVGGEAVEAKDAAVDLGAGVASKAQEIVESIEQALDIDLDDNKVANALADLEKQFEGLEESAKFKEALEFVEGIGPAFAGKLKDAGVANVLDLLRQGATRKGRVNLAEKSGIAGKLILEWVNHADLYRIKGVGSEYADLLEAAGVDTVPELAQRNPVKLIEKILATNEASRLVRRTPHPSDVEDWVGQAKKLPRIIQY